MNSIDENAKVGLELTTTGLRLTAKLLIGIMNLFMDKTDKKKYYQNLDTKQGQQKLKDLFLKGEVQPLEDNISKEEMLNFKKEFKKMGVDFSVNKVGKDEYSLFFAGKDREAIEKGMENSIIKYAKKQQLKENVKGVFKGKGIKENKNKVKDQEKKKPQFDIKDLQERSKEKVLDNKQEKVRTKTPKRTI